MEAYLLIVILFWSGHMEKVEVVTKTKEECEIAYSKVKEDLTSINGSYHTCLQGSISSWGFIAGDRE